MRSEILKGLSAPRAPKKLAQIACDVMLLNAASRSFQKLVGAFRRAGKPEHPSIPWSDIAGIGSVLRHDNDDVNLDVIVKLRGAPVTDLRAAVVALLKKYDPESDRFIDR